MNEILECTFPEYLEDPSCQDLSKVFLDPLFQILRDRGTSKNANAAACFCLRHMVQNLTNRHSHLVTPAFSRQFTNVAIRHKVTHTHFVETLIDLMRFHGDGRYENRSIEGIVDEKLKQLFEYSLNSISTMMANCKGQLVGGQLADIIALLRLQEKMVTGSEAKAKYLIPFHYNDAMKTLDLFKEVKNKNVQEHVEAARASWQRLHMQADVSQRDDSLDKLRSRMGPQAQLQIERENERLGNLQKAQTV